MNAITGNIGRSRRHTSNDVNPKLFSRQLVERGFGPFLCHLGTSRWTASFPLDANMRSSYEEKKNELADKPFFLSCVPVQRRAQLEAQAVHHHNRLCILDLVEAQDEAWNVSKREIWSPHYQTSHFPVRCHSVGTGHMSHRLAPAFNDHLDHCFILR